MADVRRKLRILVPLDRSPESEAVLAAVMPLARSQPVQLTVMHVYPAQTSREEAKEYVSKACRGLLLQGVRASSRVDTGDPAVEILYLMNQKMFDLVAMSTHARGGLRRLLLGSVTEHVVRHSKVPVLVVRPGVTVRDWGQIVVAVDGSLPAERVLDDVIPIAKTLDARVHLLRVHDSARGMSRSAPYLRRWVDRFEGQGVACIPALRRGRSGEQILRYARQVDAGLIAVATGGRTGVSRAILGSVAEEVLRAAPCAVLVRRKAARTDRMAQ